MHLKFANCKCPHYTHINYEITDMSNNLIVVIISQRDYTFNRHIVQSLKNTLILQPTHFTPKHLPKRNEKKKYKGISISIHRNFI